VGSRWTPSDYCQGLGRDECYESQDKANSLTGASRWGSEPVFGALPHIEPVRFGGRVALCKSSPRNQQGLGR